MNLKVKITLLALLTTISTTKAFAKEYLLATISRDDNSKTYQLSIESEGEREIKHFYKTTFLGGKRVNRELLDHNLLESSKGIVLENTKGLDILALKSTNFDNFLGGMITIDTLYNGATKERKKYTTDFSQSTKGWELRRNNSQITKITIITNKLPFVGVVGIKNLVMK